MPFTSHASSRTWHYMLILLTLLLCATQAVGDFSLSSVHDELTNTIRELQIHGEPDDFDVSLKTLINQLELLQVPPGKPLQLDWGDSAASTLTGHKRVCFVVSSFEGLYLNSGIGTAYYGLAELLARSGHDVTVLYTRDTPTIGGSFSDWVARYKQQNINLKFLPPSTTRIANPKLQTTSLQIYRYLKNNPFDIVQFADFEGLGYYSTLAKHIGIAFTNTIFVAGLHGPTRWILEANTGRSPAHESELEVDWMERLSMEYADYVWTPSSYLASWLSLQGWNFSSEIQLLPLPPGPEMHQLTIAPITRTMPKELVYFGRLEKRKGLLLFCDALDILSKMSTMLPQNLTVTFLGSSGFVDGQNSTDYVRTRTANWPFHVKIMSDASRVTSLRYITEPNSGRLPVIPSLVDNAPYTVFECLYAGIPFLASATPSIIPLLANGNAQNEHLFDTKPHNLASRLVTAFKSGVLPAAGVYNIAQAEQAWLSFYNRIQPKQEAPASTAQPLVSVIITHFNRPDLVRQTLQSVEEQDYKNYEVILVDDGSSDAAALQYLESIKPYFEQKNWQLIQTGNKYLGAARNAAAKVAKGEYLIFLDDDNAAYPNQISTYVKVALKTKADVFTSAHSIFRGLTPPAVEKTERFWVPLGGSLTVGLFKNCFGDANFFVNKTAFFAVGGFTEEFGVGLEDHEFFAKSVFAGQKLVVVPEPLLHYRIHNEQTQMVFTTDPRMGEARRIRPYLAALAPSSATEDVETETASARTRRSVVTLVARNALDTKEDCNQTLSSVNPSSGPISGGTLITMNGVGFSCGVTAVQVNGVACTGIKILSNTQISCTTPPGAKVYTAYDITAEVGGSAVTLYASWTYLPLAAPQLSSCVVQNSGTDIICTFDVPTNQTSGSSCTTIFSPATAAKFGSGFTCMWTDSSNIDIGMTSTATINFNDSVTVVANAVYSQGEGGLPNQETTVPLLRPANPVKPGASLSVPSIVSSCDGVTLDATGTTGNAGRAFIVDWELVSVSPSTSLVDAIRTIFITANNSAQLSITLDNSTLAADTAYTFSVSFTNWLNQTSVTTATVTKSSQSVPNVTIAGASLRQLTADTALTLVGSASATCGTTLGSIAYLWSFSPDVTTLDTSARSSATLTIPADTLSPGATYTVTLTVTDTTSSLKNSVNVTVVVGIDDLVVMLTGGNKQYHTSDVVTLNATGSYDPDKLAPLGFSWTCASFYDATQACNINLPAEGTITANADTLGVGKWLFTVTVSGSDARTANASAWVEVLETLVLSISIKDIGSAAVDPFSNLTLTGILNTANVSIVDVAWNWTLTSGTINDLSTAYSSPLTSQILVIEAGALTQGTTYSYQLTATDSQSGATGVASITFSVAKASSAEFNCASATGIPESTEFVYTFAETAAVQHYEVTYQYSDVKVNIPVAEISTSHQITTLLPAGTLAITGYVLSAADNSVVSTDTCSATLSFSSSSAGITTLTSAAGGSSLTSFDVARIAFSARATYQADNTVSVSGVYEQLIPALQAVATSGATQAASVANAAALYALSDPTLWTLSTADLSTLMTVFSSVIAEHTNYVATIDINVLQLDVLVLSNFVSQIGNIIWDSKTRNVRSVEAFASQADAYNSVMDLMTSLSSLLSSRISSGQSEMEINSAGLDVSIEKVNAATANANGVSIGPGPQLKLSSNFLPTAATAASSVTLVFSRYAQSPYPLESNTTLASRVMMVAVSADGTAENLGAVPVLLTVGSANLVSAPAYQCMMYTNNQWTTLGVTTSSDSSGVSCSFPQQATYAVAALTSNVATNNKAAASKHTGLSGGAIAGIAIGGAIGLAAVVAGAVFGARKYKNRPPRAAARPAAGPAAVSNVVPAGPSMGPVVPIAGPSTVQPALTGVAVERNVSTLPATPAAAVAGSSHGGLHRSPSASSAYSSGTRSYAGSSSSSEEEIMEQEIKNIVGELTHALPRDSRALEVLGDKLEME